MTDWQVADFGPTKTGPQFEWLHVRLTLHGFPMNKFMSTLKERLRAFQLSLGYKGTGADGYMGPLTLMNLKKDPKPTTPFPAGIDTKNWKETLPVGEKGNPMEVYPIGDFQMAPWFVRNNGHLIFRSNAGAVTTENSVHGRSELREMDGDDEAKWDTNDGRDHLLAGNLAITAFPDLFRTIVFGQSHDGDDDVFMLAAQGHKDDPNFFDIEVWRSLGKDKGNDKETVFENLTLNTFFDYQMLFTEAGFFLMVNDREVYEYGGYWEDCYWKAGCYPQTNTKKGEKASAFGEVDYAGLLASHK